MLGLSSIFLFNSFLHVFCNSTKTSANSSVLVMVLVKLTILVNKVHFRSVRGVTICDFLAQTSP